MFQNGGPAFAVADSDGPPGEVDLVDLGTYELVEPVGPEQPVYVAAVA